MTDDPNGDYAIALRGRLEAWLEQDRRAHPIEDDVDHVAALFSSMVMIIARRIVAGAASPEGAIKGAQLFGHLLISATTLHWNDRAARLRAAPPASTAEH